MLDSNFADGTPCGGAGKCEGGQCQRGAWQDEAASWITNNKQICKSLTSSLSSDADYSLAIPVIVVAGLIVLAILYTCVRSCCRRSKRNRTAPSAAYNKRKSKKSKVAAIVPGVAAAGHHSNHNSPTNANGSYNNYAPPPQPNAASYNNSQSSLMRETTPSNRNSFGQQPAFGAPNYPPPSGNYPGQSPGGFAAPAPSYQPSYSNRSSAQYAAPSGPPPQQSSPLGWNPPQTQSNTQGNWVE